MPNIIFVEGVSGVGKTTTSTLLHEKLQNMGHQAICYLEGAKDNPLDPFNGEYPPEGIPLRSRCGKAAGHPASTRNVREGMPLQSFSNTYMECWQNFVEEYSSNTGTFILDGTLFHHQINDLIREYNAPDDIVLSHLSGLLCVIQQFKPIIFYLSASDVARRLRQARESRKQPPATAERIAFWENRKRVDLYVLERLSVDAHIFNVDNGWDAIVETQTL